MLKFKALRGYAPRRLLGLCSLTRGSSCRRPRGPAPPPLQTRPLDPELIGVIIYEVTTSRSDPGYQSGCKSGDL